MTYSEAYNYYSMAYAGTTARIDDLLSSVWLWDPPSELPTMYVQKPMSTVIAPHIETTSFKRFLGHKFRLGGSKK